MSERIPVCVLGMHHSGASHVAHALAALGVDFGIRGQSANPTDETPDRFESGAIGSINDAILRRFGGSWWDPPVLEPGWVHDSRLADLHDRAHEIVDARSSGSPHWGLEDHRTSLTVPFWQEIVGAMRFLVCLRNPIDVARSIGASDAEPMPFELGTRLWLTYVRATLAATSGHDRHLLFWEDLVADPQSMIEGLAGLLGIDVPAAVNEAAAAIGRRASEEGSTSADVVTAAELPLPVRALYLALRQFVPGAEPVEAATLDRFAADVTDRRDGADNTFRLAEALERLGALEAERRDLELGLERRRAELESIRKSRIEERRLRRELEADLSAVRAELERAREIVRDDRDGPAESPAGSPEHSRFVADVVERAHAILPPGATVLVAGKGDESLLRIEGSRGRHFPAAADGSYIGYHLSCDTSMIAQLEAGRVRGADHLLLPATTLWWLDHYEDLRRHLVDRYELLHEDDICVIYRLVRKDLTADGDSIHVLRRAVTALGTDPRRGVSSILDWDTGLEITDHLPEMAVFVPPASTATLPYLDGTVDVVAVTDGDPARVAEASRVATAAVVEVDQVRSGHARLKWLAGDPAKWGEDVEVVLLCGDDENWAPTVEALAEEVRDGFAGAVSMVGSVTALASIADGAGAVPGRAIECAPGAGLADRTRAATETSAASLHVFLTAPAVLLPGWLPSILALYSSRPGAGVVGARIVSADGRLIAAGGIVTGGLRRRHGAGDLNPDRPEYCFARPVDFCSPPLLATRRDVFERVGGFAALGGADSLIDFSLRAGRSGAQVLYQPQARVVTFPEARG